MTLEDSIQLRTIRNEARLLSPLEGYAEVRSGTELRIDPLTGRIAIIGLNLSGKRAVLYSETDHKHLSRLATSTRQGCFFCPERVEQVTPRYPPDVLGGDGRLRRGDSLLFPNLFPLTDFHAVVALGQQHFRRLDEFPASLFLDGLGLAVEFIREVMSRRESPIYWTICSNYLPPGGASIVHPHIQILGSTVPLSTHALELERARAYGEANRSCYFDDLVEREGELGERLIERHGPVTWLAAFAPRGNTELQGICAEVAHLTELKADHLGGLAAGLSQGLSAYHSLGYSTFNFCLYSAPLGLDADRFRVYASLISRQSVVEDYRCDDYFLQKMLGTEIVIDTPEQIAELVRRQTP